MIQLTQGMAYPGLKILEKIDEATRLCTVYADDDGNIYVGFGGTRNNLWDWISNLNPEIEAMTLLGMINHWIYVYQPAKVTLLGHSQGGAHAEIIARHVTAKVVTFGGLPAGGFGIHYLNRSDPMAWLPVVRRGKVVKFGKPGFSLKAHDPASYLTVPVI